MNQKTVRDIMIRTRSKGLAAFLLQRMADRDPGKPPYCWASTATLAAEMNATRRTVTRARKELLALGEIKKVGTKRIKTASGKQMIPVFTVALEKIMAYPPRQGGDNLSVPEGVTGCQALTGCHPLRGCQVVSTSPKEVKSCHPKESIPVSIAKAIDTVIPGGRAGKFSKPHHDPDVIAWLEERS